MPLNTLRSIIPTQHETILAQRIVLDAQIDKAERKLKNLIDLFTDGQISKEEFAEFKATYSADFQKFKDEKARCGEQQELFESCMCDMTAVLRLSLEWWI